MTDAPALWPALGVGHHLGLERGMQLAAQEAQDVDRGHVQAGMADQVGPHLEQGGPGLEHDVGGDLGLVEHPVVAAVVGGRGWREAEG